MPDNLAAALADDPDGLLDEDIPEMECVAEVIELPVLPDNLPSVHAQIVRNTTYEEWNDIVRAARAADPNFRITFNGQTFYEQNFAYRDLRGADFRGADLEYCSLNNCQLQDAEFDENSDVYYVRFSYADLTGSNLRNAFRVEHARGLDSARGYVPPLPDITQAVAMHYLTEAIDDPNSILNEGLEELRSDTFQLYWDGLKLKFYTNFEIERYRDPCKEGDCDCEIEHSCGGSCSCCPCSRGDCDCERYHPEPEERDLDPTGEMYLSTIVGHVEFQWNSSLGYIGSIVMDRLTRHPHVSVNGNICWGDAQMPRTIKPIDYLIVMMGWMGTHNPSDPYREITTDLPRIR